MTGESVHSWSNRLGYLISAGAVLVLGLGSRRFRAYLPAFVAEYAGDTLWALMVFLGISALAPHARMSRRAAIALATAYLVEVSQLYHAPWINSLRHTPLGGLVLGFGFLWSDLACYTAGIALGVVLERASFHS
jgi:hypothetical protein